jgi:hypothetical protein
MSEFKDEVLTVFRQMGGRGTAEQIWAHVRAHATPEDIDKWVTRGGIAAIGSALRSASADTGLPFAPAVDGVYVQDTLLTLQEYAHLIVDRKNRGNAEFKRVREYQVKCQEVHDVWLEVADAQDIVDRRTG